jgi:hypothetical protein
LIDDHFFAAQGTVGFGPLEFAGLALHLEVLVAFGAAEFEHFGVVADEGDAFGGVDWAGAEVACLDPGMVSTWGHMNLAQWTYLMLKKGALRRYGLCCGFSAVYSVLDKTALACCACQNGMAVVAVL